MIELSRHIEILLLSNDCVIVPGLGGFMAHHVDARYDEESHIFLPPLRTLGFNPQLKINDSLLAQSYVEAYDISYPEALRRIEEEVEELTQHIHNEGCYELTGIGTLTQNSEGNYIFSPCEAGILTPSLYALATFDFPKLAKATAAAPQATSAPEKKAKPEQKSKPEQKAKPEAVVKVKPATVEPEAIAPKAKETVMKPVEEPVDEETPITPFAAEEDEGSEALVIKLSWIRNAVAVAAAVVMFILMTTPISNSEPNLAYTNIGTSVLFDTTKKIVTPKPAETKPVEIKLPQDCIKTAISKKDSIKLAIEQAERIKSAKASDSIKAALAEVLNEKDEPAAKQSVTGYCIVLASYVSKKNANAFVERLHKAGFNEAEVYIRNNVTRVIYGNFHSLSDAYNRLNSIRGGNKDFEEAWVLKTTDRG